MKTRNHREIMKKNELEYLQNDFYLIISVSFIFLCIEYDPVNQLIPISVL